jgi:hypothetical protein
VPRRDELALAGGPVRLVFTDAADGDLRVDGDAARLAARRGRIAGRPWTWLRQVHGADVVVVDRPGGGAGAEADAAVTARPGAVLAVHTADCAGVLLVGARPDGSPVVGAAHAGWRGLSLGVLQATVAAMGDLGAERVVWRLGPCISPAAYEFGEDDLAGLCDRYGGTLRSRTVTGRPALDLRAGVRAALAEAGVDAGPDVGDGHGGAVPCTALDAGFFSWRARRDTGRQAAVVWIEESR